MEMKRKHLEMFKHLHDSEQAPPHPGEILSEDVLPHTGLTAAELASHLGVTPSLIADLIAERASVTADLALRLGKALGQGARYWLGLQAQHDLWVAMTSEAPRVKAVHWGRRAA